MGWLSQSLGQDTVAWVVISSLVGGVIGAATRFGFEDVLRPHLGATREIRATTRKFSTPLIRSAESLERRINNFLRNLGQGWYGTDDYYRMSTLYVFANYLAWNQIIEEKFGFLPYEASRSGRVFNKRLNGFFRALSSFSYFSWSADGAAVEASQIPRLALTAMGELVENPDASAPLRFSEFTELYRGHESVRDAFGYLDKFLLGAEAGDPFCRDRLIAAGANLRALIRLLDKRGSFVALRDVSNLGLVVHPEVGRHLAEEFQYLARNRRGRSTAAAGRGAGTATTTQAAS
jgi:hypothetical protein